jgi:hypothetical protein
LVLDTQPAIRRYRSGVPHFLLSVHHPEFTEPPAPEVMERAYREVGLFNDELHAAKALVYGGGLLPPSTAKVVLASDAATIITDGPHNVADELGGFWIIDSADMSSALDWAAKAARACSQAVQVRQLADHA